MYVPENIRRRAAPRTSNQLPLQFEGLNGPPFEGQSFFVSVPDVEHATLCRAFRLDPARFWFDVPSSLRGTGSSSGSHSGTRRHIHGFIFLAGQDEPVARFRVVDPEDKFRDLDPTSQQDLEDLAKWVRR